MSLFRLVVPFNISHLHRLDSILLSVLSVLSALIPSAKITYFHPFFPPKLSWSFVKNATFCLILFKSTLSWCLNLILISVYNKFIRSIARQSRISMQKSFLFCSFIYLERTNLMWRRRASIFILTRMASHEMWKKFVLPFRLGFLFICLLNAKCKHSIHIYNLYILISISSWWLFGQLTIRGINKLHILSAPIQNANKLILLYVHWNWCLRHSQLFVIFYHSWLLHIVQWIVWIPCICQL